MLRETEKKLARVVYPAVVLIPHGQRPWNSIAVQVAYLRLFIVLIRKFAESQTLKQISERIERGYGDGDPAASLFQNDTQNHDHKAGC